MVEEVASVSSSGLLGLVLADSDNNLCDWYFLSLRGQSRHLHRLSRSLLDASFVQRFLQVLEFSESSKEVLALKLMEESETLLDSSQSPLELSPLWCYLFHLWSLSFGTVIGATNMDEELYEALCMKIWSWPDSFHALANLGSSVAPRADPHFSFLIKILSEEQSIAMTLDIFLLQSAPRCIQRLHALYLAVQCCSSLYRQKEFCERLDRLLAARLNPVVNADLVQACAVAAQFAKVFLVARSSSFHALEKVFSVLARTACHGFISSFRPTQLWERCIAVLCISDYFKDLVAHELLEQPCAACTSLAELSKLLSFYLAFANRGMPKSWMDSEMASRAFDIFFSQAHPGKGVSSPSEKSCIQALTALAVLPVLEVFDQQRTHELVVEVLVSVRRFGVHHLDLGYGNDLLPPFIPSRGGSAVDDDIQELLLLLAVARVADDAEGDVEIFHQVLDTYMRTVTSKSVCRFSVAKLMDNCRKFADVLSSSREFHVGSAQQLLRYHVVSGFFQLCWAEVVSESRCTRDNLSLEFLQQLADLHSGFGPRAKKFFLSTWSDLRFISSSIPSSLLEDVDQTDEPDRCFRLLSDCFARVRKAARGRAADAQSLLKLLQPLHSPPPSTSSQILVGYIQDIAAHAAEVAEGDSAGALVAQRLEWIRKHWELVSCPQERSSASILLKLFEAQHFVEVIVKAINREGFIVATPPLQEEKGTVFTFTFSHLLSAIQIFLSQAVQGLACLSQSCDVSLDSACRSYSWHFEVDTFLFAIGFLGMGSKDQQGVYQRMRQFGKCFADICSVGGNIAMRWMDLAHLLGQRYIESSLRDLAAHFGNSMDALCGLVLQCKSRRSLDREVDDSVLLAWPALGLSEQSFADLYQDPEIAVQSLRDLVVYFPLKSSAAALSLLNIIGPQFARIEQLKTTVVAKRDGETQLLSLLSAGMSSASINQETDAFLAAVTSTQALLRRALDSQGRISLGDLILLLHSAGDCRQQTQTWVSLGDGDVLRKLDGIQKTIFKQCNNVSNLRSASVGLAETAAVGAEELRIALRITAHWLRCAVRFCQTEEDKYYTCLIEAPHLPGESSPCRVSLSLLVSIQGMAAHPMAEDVRLSIALLGRLERDLQALVAADAPAPWLQNLHFPLNYTQQVAAQIGHYASFWAGIASGGHTEHFLSLMSHSQLSTVCLSILVRGVPPISAAHIFDTCVDPEVFVAELFRSRSSLLLWPLENGGIDEWESVLRHALPHIASAAEKSARKGIVVPMISSLNPPDWLRMPDGFTSSLRVFAFPSLTDSGAPHHSLSLGWPESLALASGSCAFSSASSQITIPAPLLLLLCTEATTEAEVRRFFLAVDLLPQQDANLFALVLFPERLLSDVLPGFLTCIRSRQWLKLARPPGSTRLPLYISVEKESAAGVLSFLSTWTETTDDVMHVPDISKARIVAKSFCRAVVSKFRMQPCVLLSMRSPHCRTGKSHVATQQLRPMLGSVDRCLERRIVVTDHSEDEDVFRRLQSQSSRCCWIDIVEDENLRMDAVLFCWMLLGVVASSRSKMQHSLPKMGIDQLFVEVSIPPSLDVSCLMEGMHMAYPFLMNFLDSPSGEFGLEPGIVPLPSSSLSIVLERTASSLPTQKLELLQSPSVARQAERLMQWCISQPLAASLRDFHLQKSAEFVASWFVGLGTGAPLRLCLFSPETCVTEPESNLTFVVPWQGRPRVLLLAAPVAGTGSQTQSHCLNLPRSTLSCEDLHESLIDFMLDMFCSSSKNQIRLWLRQIGFVMSQSFAIKILLLETMRLARLPLILSGETGSGKTLLVSVWARLAGMETEQTCFVMDLNPSSTEVSVAQEIERAKNRARGRPAIVFFDEINCSGCQHMFKELLDGMLVCRNQVERLPQDLYVIGACNPMRSSVQAVYSVKHLPRSLETCVFDVGRVSPGDLRVIFTRLSLDAYPLSDDSSMGPEKRACIVSLFVDVFQKLVALCESSPSTSSSCISSPPSLRDLARLFRFVSFFQDALAKDSCPFLPLDQGDGGSKHLLLSAVVLAVFVCLVSRTPLALRSDLIAFVECWLHVSSSDGAAFEGGLSSLSGDRFLEGYFRDTTVKFAKTVCRGDPSIVFTAALCENLFLIYACVFTFTPLFIVGTSGASKSVSVSLLMKAQSDKASAFLSFYPEISVRTIQCSRSLSGSLLKDIFNRATKYAGNRNRVVLLVLEEIGMTESARDITELKALHPLLDQYFGAGAAGLDYSLSFLALSNTFLDAAKMNRGVVLLRPDIDRTSLLELVDSFLQDLGQSFPDQPSPLLDRCRSLLSKLVQLALEMRLLCVETTAHLGRNRVLPGMFGLRDVFQLLNSVSAFFQLLRNSNGTAVPRWERELDLEICRRFIHVFGGLSCLDASQCVMSALEACGWNTARDGDLSDLLLSGMHPTTEVKVSVEATDMVAARAQMQHAHSSARTATMMSSNRHLLLICDTLPPLHLMQMISLGLQRELGMFRFFTSFTGKSIGGRRQNTSLPSGGSDVHLGELVAAMSSPSLCWGLLDYDLFSCCYELFNGLYLRRETSDPDGDDEEKDMLQNLCRMPFMNESVYKPVHDHFLFVVCETPKSISNLPHPLVNRLRKVVLNANDVNKLVALCLPRELAIEQLLLDLETRVYSEAHRCSRLSSNVDIFEKQEEALLWCRHSSRSATMSHADLQQSLFSFAKSFAHVLRWFENANYIENIAQFCEHQVRMLEEDVHFSELGNWPLMHRQLDGRDDSNSKNNILNKNDDQGDEDEESCCWTHTLSPDLDLRGILNPYKFRCVFVRTHTRLDLDVIGMLERVWPGGNGVCYVEASNHAPEDLVRITLDSLRKSLRTGCMNTVIGFLPPADPSAKTGGHGEAHTNRIMHFMSLLFQSLLFGPPPSGSADVEDGIGEDGDKSHDSADASEDAQQQSVITFYVVSSQPARIDGWPPLASPLLSRNGFSMLPGWLYATVPFILHRCQNSMNDEDDPVCRAVYCRMMGHLGVPEHLASLFDCRRMRRDNSSSEMIVFRAYGYAFDHETSRLLQSRACLLAGVAGTAKMEFKTEPHVLPDGWELVFPGLTGEESVHACFDQEEQHQVVPVASQTMNWTETVKFPPISKRLLQVLYRLVHHCIGQKAQASNLMEISEEEEHTKDGTLVRLVFTAPSPILQPLKRVQKSWFLGGKKVTRCNVSEEHWAEFKRQHVPLDKALLDANVYVDDSGMMPATPMASSRNTDYGYIVVHSVRIEDLKAFLSRLDGVKASLETVEETFFPEQDTRFFQDAFVRRMAALQAERQGVRAFPFGRCGVPLNEVHVSVPETGGWAIRTRRRFMEAAQEALRLWWNDHVSRVCIKFVYAPTFAWDFLLAGQVPETTGSLAVSSPTHSLKCRWTPISSSFSAAFGPSFVKGRMWDIPEPSVASETEELSFVLEHDHLHRPPGSPMSLQHRGMTIRRVEPGKYTVSSSGGAEAATWTREESGGLHSGGYLELRACTVMGMDTEIIHRHCRRLVDLVTAGVVHRQHVFKILPTRKNALLSRLLVQQQHSSVGHHVFVAEEHQRIVAEVFARSEAKVEEIVKAMQAVEDQMRKDAIREMMAEENVQKIPMLPSAQSLEQSFRKNLLRHWEDRIPAGLVLDPWFCEELEARYQQVKAANPGCKEFFAFHGTKSDAVHMIRVHGLKIGNNNASGPGVYSSPQWNTAMGYARGNGRPILLCKVWGPAEHAGGNILVSSLTGAGASPICIWSIVPVACVYCDPSALNGPAVR